MNSIFKPVSKEWHAKKMASIARKEAYLLSVSEKNKRKEFRTQERKRWRAYHAKVWEITKQQPLHELDDFHLRGWKEYELDHMVSVKHGFTHDIPAEWVGNLNNLRIVTCEVNLAKGTKSLPGHLEAMIDRLRHEL